MASPSTVAAPMADAKTSEQRRFRRCAFAVTGEVERSDSLLRRKCRHLLAPGSLVAGPAMDEDHGLGTRARYAGVNGEPVNGGRADGGREDERTNQELHWDHDTG